MTKATVTLLTAMAMAAPAFAGDSAFSALLGATDPQAVRGMAPQAPEATEAKNACATKAPTQAWIAEAKKAYTKLIENGDLFLLPEAKKSELPKPALDRLNKDNADQHSYGPTFAATAYKIMVQGKKVFIIHNDRDGHSLTAHLFDADGRVLAIGHADEATPLWWEKLNAATGGPASSGGSASGGYANPGYNHGSGPDAIDDGSGNGPAGGGPDDTDWDGCGSTGSGSGYYGPDGSGGGADF